MQRHMKIDALCATQVLHVCQIFTFVWLADIAGDTNIYMEHIALDCDFQIVICSCYCVRVFVELAPYLESCQKKESIW